jgi:chloride channel 3/4/5
MLWSKKVRAKTWMARHPLYEVILITILTVAVSFMNEYTRMGGPELIADLFSECHEHESLEGLCVSRPSQIGPLVSSVAWAMIVKGILTIITFGIKLPAGIFIPTLCVGACFGRIVGLLVQYAQWTHPNSQFFAWCGAEQQGSACIVPGVYAMIGAAATLSGVTRTTISLVVIMFELTGTLTYSVPVMLSVLVARTIADGLEHKGIYDLVLEFSGLPYLDAKEEHTWQGVSIVDALDTDVEVIDVDEGNTVASLREKLEHLALVTRNPDGGFPIVCSRSSSTSNTFSLSTGSPRRRLVGYIAAQELEHGLNRVVAAEEADVDPTRLMCTFNFLPRPDVQPSDSAQTSENSSHGADRASAEQYMRDSTLLASIDSPRDLSIFVDRAPITLTTCSPLELVHQMFVKLGVRYLIALNADGTLNGVIFKKRWLAFLHTLDKGRKHA